MVSPFELNHHNIDAETSREVFLEAFDAVTHGLTHEKLDHSGKHFSYQGVPMELAPAQQPHPPFWYPSSNPESSPWSDSQGLNFLTLGKVELAGVEDLVECFPVDGLGEVKLEHLRRVPYREAKEVLTSLPGVGDKVADCVLLFSLDKMDACPIDRWVRRAMEEWYLDGDKLNYRDIRAWSLERWGGYAGYAQQYLFHQKRLEGQVQGLALHP